MWPFTKRQKPTRDDSDFGNITEWKRGSWKGHQFELWGYNGVQVVLDADENGPSQAQRSLCRDLRANTADIREHVESEIRRYIPTIPGVMAPSTNPIQLASIYLPQDPAKTTWRVWYDLEGEDIFWFGAEIEPSKEIVPFAED